MFSAMVTLVCEGKASGVSGLCNALQCAADSDCDQNHNERDLHIHDFILEAPQQPVNMCG